MQNIRERLEMNEKLILCENACFSAESRGRDREEEKSDFRTEFQRDRDRIIHCKAFRRLKHKTQVFITPSGDHYRTRLTHTLEVEQIARTIARALRLNEDLTEAMSLGHDIGHTPFGHAGERCLDRLCSEGFKHNEQSVRVCEYLEKDGEGLNLTFEVRDGILNHTGDGMPSTLEGQILKFADRIAYINHDIDDAVRAGILTEEYIPSGISELLGDSPSKRIDTLISDIIYTSYGKNIIKMSEDIENAAGELRSFMFENVYNYPEKRDEERKADGILSAMFEYFIKNPDMMPEDVKKFLNMRNTERVVCDYIASMSDDYAVYAYNKLFVPKSWSIM